MESIVEDVMAHAAEFEPNECCGLVVLQGGTLRYVRCVNAASDTANRFFIRPEDYAAAEDLGDIVMVAHSHPYIPAEPSEEDRVGCEKSGIPWLIVNYPNGNYTVTEPCGYKAPLIGRQFCKGLVDCYALVRDYFGEKLNVQLPDYVRPEYWVENEDSILVKNFKAFGFREITLDELQPNDCLLMQVAANIPNHCAVYIGDNMILHHVKDRLSARDIYGSFWRKTTTHYLRYEG